MSTSVYVRCFRSITLTRFKVRLVTKAVLPSRVTASSCAPGTSIRQSTSPVRGSSAITSFVASLAT